MGWQNKRTASVPGEVVCKTWHRIAIRKRTREQKGEQQIGNSYRIRRNTSSSQGTLVVGTDLDCHRLHPLVERVHFLIHNRIAKRVTRRCGVLWEQLFGVVSVQVQECGSLATATVVSGIQCQETPAKNSINQQRLCS
jgi:hypothetical protein